MIVLVRHQDGVVLTTGDRLCSEISFDMVGAWKMQEDTGNKNS